MQARGRPATDPLDARAWHARLPVAALLSFAAATCGVGTARRHVVDAASSLLDGDVAPGALAAWVDRQWHVPDVQLLRGETAEYDLVRATLVPRLFDACRVHALAIAATAADAATAEAWSARAARDFAAPAGGPWGIAHENRP